MNLKRQNVHNNVTNVTMYGSEDSWDISAASAIHDQASNSYYNAVANNTNSNCYKAYSKLNDWLIRHL